MPFFKCCNRNGLTLVEVVAGMLLLATLLVGILTAYGSHVRQIKRAQRKLEAVALADRLLESWVNKPNQSIMIGHGGGDANIDKTKNIKNTRESPLIWQTTVLEDRQLQNMMDVKIVRLEIRDANATKENDILTAVEVIVPASSPNGKYNK